MDGIMRWFHLWWWRYLLKDNEGIRNIVCRIGGHGHCIWYDSNGHEPDMRCENCGEYLGGFKWTA